jgi:lipopolysaccharide export system permease protein
MLVLALACGCRPAVTEYDVIIRNGLVYDGLGSPPVAAAVAIDGDRIVEVGALEGARVALFGGPGDCATSQAVSAAITHAPVTDLTGQLDLVSAAACLQRARLFVGNDSGLMHMAAAAGAPVLGLFGPTDERVYGPWGRNARSVRAGGPAEEADRGRLRHAETSLMGGLALEQVRAAAEALIEESQA